MRRRPNHITQPDGRVIKVLPRGDYLVKAAMRLGRRFTPAERKAALEARARGVGPTAFGDELRAANANMSAAS